MRQKARLGNANYWVQIHRPCLPGLRIWNGSWSRRIPMWVRCEVRRLLRKVRPKVRQFPKTLSHTVFYPYNFDCWLFTSHYLLSSCFTSFLLFLCVVKIRCKVSSQRSLQINKCRCGGKGRLGGFRCRCQKRMGSSPITGTSFKRDDRTQLENCAMNTRITDTKKVEFGKH